MNLIDIIILICCVPAVIQGLSKGFISQVIALVSVVVGAWLSFKLSNPLASWLKGYMDISGTILQVVAFAIILTIVIVGLKMLGKMLEGVVKIVMLGWLNKLLGATFALLKVILLIGLVIVLIDSINSVLPIIPTKAMDESLLYHPVKDIANSVFPYLRELIFNK